MPDRFLYLLIDAGCMFMPVLLSFHPAIRFYKQWKFYFPASILSAAFFVIWDIIFTKEGVWSFNSRYVLGFYFFNLPIEELAFFICIPFACTFNFYCCIRFIKTKFNHTLINAITRLLAAILLVIAAFHVRQVYTSVTFTLLGIFLLFLASRKAWYLPWFYISFLLILLPFLIANGILTGLWIAEPVVKYNDLCNLRLRIFTIPVEDVFYGMLLQLMNAAGFVYLMGRAAHLAPFPNK